MYPPQVTRGRHGCQWKTPTRTHTALTSQWRATRCPSVWASVNKAFLAAASLSSTSARARVSCAPQVAFTRLASSCGHPPRETTTKLLTKVCASFYQLAVCSNIRFKVCSLRCVKNTLAYFFRHKSIKHKSVLFTAVFYHDCWMFL